MRYTYLGQNWEGALTITSIILLFMAFMILAVIGLLRLYRQKHNPPAHY